jgi:manganese transport protein
VVSIYEEMAARVAIATRSALFDAVRERLGFRLALIPLLSISAVNLLTLVGEIFGMSYALQMATGIHFLIWSVPCAFAMWLILWRGSFTLIEDGSSILGLFILVFVWAASRLDPPVGEIATQMWAPNDHGHGWALYAYSALALIGAYASPYQVLFYSSGAVEEDWSDDYRWPNRIIAVIGNLFGTVVAFAIIIVAALTLYPTAEVDDLKTAGLGVINTLGAKGFWLFIAGVFFCSMAAGLETAMASTYAISEYFGWYWKKDEPPVRSALFHLTYMLFLIVALLVLLTGISPIKIIETSMVFNAIALPFALFPLMLVAGDERFTREPFYNGRFSNIAGWFLLVLLSIASLAGIPLFFITGGGG